MMAIQLKDLFDGFRDPATLSALAEKIQQRAEGLSQPLRIMEVCGGHTHSIMRYALPQLLPKQIEFIHGPGCPVCIMPKERIDQAIALAFAPNHILVTLGDMLRVPGSKGSLAQARAQGAAVHAVYSPLETLKIAQQNPDKQVIFFAIGFETTTPMTAALLAQVIALRLTNVFFHINHVLVPPAVSALLAEQPCHIDALIAPSHVSVISGAKIYQSLLETYNIPIVVSGFEPVDLLQSILQLLDQYLSNQPALEVQYSRAVNWQGNLKAQALIEQFFQPRAHFRWRGLGDIPRSGLQLKPDWQAFDAEIAFADLLSHTPIDDHKRCICGDILRGRAKPHECKVFARGCDPQHPLGSCMVSSEGACHAYYRYAKQTPEVRV
ncbi:hydrogenase formation protein HypD [Thiomicrospira microaerophila]|uniref:hydrogenase formation protein HypD n=1 Tax=Thiomicrospira microaerophila TaxID=406020 RepID=UPI0020106385|nr:hydrogenase formation protein HypD [Thiomicrospira microaerophila]UQB42507.1 hydrogenase formation protein HypD [Thiomicrospira microaerophila]